MTLAGEFDTISYYESRTNGSY